MTKGEKVIVFIFVVVAFALVLYKISSRNSLRKKHLTTTGKCKNVYWQGLKGTAEYRLQVEFCSKNGKKYVAENSVPCKELSEKELRDSLLDKSFIIVYDSEKPFINDLLTTKRTYEIYNIPMPDSLQWIDSFLSCKGRVE